MAWTYSGDPTNSPKDEIRFLIGDTKESDPELQDEEINYAIVLAYGGSAPPSLGNYRPAVFCADALIARYAASVDKSIGDLHISHSQRLVNFKALANKLRTRAALAAVPVYAGGQSLAEKRQLDSDPDRVEPAGKINGMNYVDSIAETESSQSTIP